MLQISDDCPSERMAAMNHQKPNDLNPYRPPGCQKVPAQSIGSWMSATQKVGLVAYCVCFAILMEIALLVVGAGVLGGLKFITGFQSHIQSNQLNLLALVVATGITIRVTFHAGRVEIDRLRRVHLDDP